MIKKITLCTLAASAIALAGMSAPITPERALERALNGKHQKIAGKFGDKKSLLFTKTTESGSPAVYVFSDDKNALILSADDQAYAVLGYTDASIKSEKDMAPGLQWMIDQYAAQIEYVNASDKTVSGVIYNAPAEWSAIAPMIKTKWDQDAPYNNECPKSGSITTYTGCVATSMAQVMNYFKYPEIGEGSKTYKTTRLNKTLLINFASKPFDWDNMLDEYAKGQYDDTQANAVAWLMKCCGYGVEMNYGTDASGAYSAYISGALKTYFKYSQATHFEKRELYSPAAWEQMIYENLKNVGPIIYNGQSSIEGGHSFVCDGYDGNGYFHFNWGWGGMSDGYFSLNALNPDALGVGGGGGGFNFNQGAVLGMQPPVEGEPVVPDYPAITQSGSLVGSISGLTMTFDLTGSETLTWISQNPDPMTVKFGAIFEPVDGTEGETLYKTASGVSSLNFTYGAGFYQTSPNGAKIEPRVNITGLSQGKYKVTLATQSQLDANAPMVPVEVPYGMFNYVYVTRNGSTYTVENMVPFGMELADISLESALYYDCNAKITLKIKNDTDEDLVQGFAPILYQGSESKFMGESILVELPAHSEVEKAIYTSFYPMEGASAVIKDTEFTLKAYNPENGNIYSPSQTVTMMKNPGSPSLSMMSVSLNGDVKDGVYNIADKHNINFKANVRVSKGYFAYPISVVISDGGSDPIMQQSVDGGSTFLNYGEEMNVDAILNFAQGVPGEVYRIMLAYMKGYNLVVVGTQLKFSVGSTGVEMLEGNDGDIQIFSTPEPGVFMLTGDVAEADVYDLSGNKVESELAGADGMYRLEIRGGKGVMILKATNTDRITKTLKLVK